MQTPLNSAASSSPLAIALNLYDQNCATVPMVPGKKVPFKGFTLARYFEKRPTLAELPVLFNRQNLSVAVLGGIPSDNAIICDSDTKEMHQRMRDALGIVTRSASSRRGGHTYIRTRVPVYGLSPHADLQIKGQGGYAIVPSAASPNYQWENDTDIAVWDSLELPNLFGPGYLSLRPVPARDRSTPPLAWNLITGITHWSTRYKTRCRADYAALCSLINKGWDFTACRRLFEAHACEATRFRKQIRLHGIEEARKVLANDYERAARFVNSNQSPAVLTARDLRQWTISAPFTGRAGESERATLMAHTKIQERCAKIEDYSADVRTLAEHAGISRQSVARANHRLIEKGLLQCVKPHTATLPRVWSITPLAIETAAGVKLLNHTSLREKDGEVSQNFTPPLNHDVFRSKWNNSKKKVNRGLSASQKATWIYLCTAAEGLRASQIAKQIGKSKRAVLTALDGLKAYGMVKEGEGRTWYGCPDVDLNAIAEQRGTKFAHVSQLARHERERREHATQLCKYEGKKN